MKQIILISIIILTLFRTVYSQERDTQLGKKLIKHGLIDAKEYALSPLHWDKKDWSIFSGLAVGTVALIAWGDQPMYDFVNAIKTPQQTNFTQNLEPLGNIYPAIAISAVLLKGIIQKDNYAFETGLIAIESYAFSGVLNRTVKLTAGRSRPNDTNSTTSHDWKGPFFNGSSFFSGHTTTAFSIASVFAYRYRDTRWVPILSYSLATLAGMERIYDNRHWTSDVFFGAVIGTATGIFLSKQWENNGIKFYPSVSSNGGGLSLVIPIK